LSSSSSQQQQQQQQQHCGLLPSLASVVSSRSDFNNWTMPLHLQHSSPLSSRSLTLTPSPTADSPTRRSDKQQRHEEESVSFAHELARFGTPTFPSMAATAFPSMQSGFGKGYLDHHSSSINLDHSQTFSHTQQQQQFTTNNNNLAFSNAHQYLAPSFRGGDHTNILTSSNGSLSSTYPTNNGKQKRKNQSAVFNTSTPSLGSLEDLKRGRFSL